MAIVMLDAVLLWLSLVFDKYYLVLLPAALALGAFVLRRRKVLLLALLLAVLLVPVIKEAFHQERPCVGAPFQGNCLPDYGMPSFHAASSSVFVMASLGTPWFWPFAAFALVAGGSRVYLGVHSIEQVAGGVALGISLYAFSGWLAGVLERGEEKSAKSAVRSITNHRPKARRSRKRRPKR